MTQTILLRITENANGISLSTRISRNGSIPKEAEATLPKELNILTINDQIQQDYKEFVQQCKRRDNVERKPNPQELKEKIQKTKSQITNGKIKLDTELNHWLDCPEMTQVLSSIDQTINRDQEIQFVVDIQCDEKSEWVKLRNVPWYFWRRFFQNHNYPNVGLSLSLPLIEVKKIQIEKPKVFAIIGDSNIAGSKDKKDQLELNEDWNTIHRHLPYAERLLERNFQQIYHRILKDSSHFIIFSGHSYTNADGQAFFQLNEDENISIYNLRPAFMQAARNGLQLLIFNSCDGSGIVKQLQDTGIPNIIFMNGALPDKVAPEFLNSFLEAFLDSQFNCSVSVALEKARLVIGRFEEEFPGVSLIPTLYTNPAFPVLRGNEFKDIPIIPSEPPIENTKSRISVRFVMLLLISSLGIGTLFFFKSHPKENHNHQLPIPTNEINKPKSLNP